MKKADLVRSMANAAGITNQQAEAALSAFTHSVTDALKKDESVTLAGFGSFSAKHRAARQGRNPATGQSMHIPARVAPAFKAAKGLKDALNECSQSMDSHEDERSEHSMQSHTDFWNRS